MSRQYKRVYELNLISPSGKVVTSKDLKVDFEITKDLFGYPNLGRIALYNLSLDRVT